MPYRKKHLKSNIHRIKPRKSIFKNRWFWIAILILVIAFTAIYFLLFFPGVQIENVYVYGNQKVPGDNIQSLVFGDIEHRFLSMGKLTVSSMSIFWVDSNKIKKQLLDNFPEIESIKISRKFFQTIEIGINERTPVAVFCPSLDETTAPENGNCYLIDRNGIIFEPLSVSGFDILRHSSDECCEISIVRRKIDAQGIAMGAQAVEQNIVNLVLKLQKELKDNFQISISQALIESPVKLNVITNENWKIYFDTSSDIDSQITKLDLLLSNQIPAEERKNLRYINLIPNSKAIICDNSACGG